MSNFPPKASDWKRNLGLLLKLAQILAIVVPGCWVLYQYLTFQREANKYSLRQQELANQQSEFLLQSQRAAEKANLAQATLAAQQAEFTLATQKAQKELREKELEYSVESKRLEIQANKTKQETDQFALNSKLTYRATRTSQLKTRKVDGGLYEVILEPGLRNTSDIPFEVSLILVDVYVGKMRTELPHPSSTFGHRGRMTVERADNIYALPLIGPPGRWSAHDDVEGAIQWEKVATTGSVYAPAIGHLKRSASWVFEEEIESGNIRMSGPGTGIWKPGETVEFEPSFIVKAQPEEYIGFSVHMCFNRGEKDEDLWWFEENKQLKGSGEVIAAEKK